MGMGVPKFGGSPKFCDTGLPPSAWALEESPVSASFLHALTRQQKNGPPCMVAKQAIYFGGGLIHSCQLPRVDRETPCFLSLPRPPASLLNCYRIPRFFPGIVT